MPESHRVTRLLGPLESDGESLRDRRIAESGMQQAQQVILDPRTQLVGNGQDIGNDLRMGAWRATRGACQPCSESRTNAASALGRLKNGIAASHA